MSGLFFRNDTPPEEEDVGPTLMAITGILTGLIIITTSSRIYVRCRRQIFGPDDAMILLAVVFSIARVAVQIKQSQHGNGKHRVKLSPYDYKMNNMWGWYGQILLFTSVACLKVSIGFLILRIKETRTFKIMVYSLIAGVCFTNFGVVIILLAECKPMGFWRGSAAKCWPSKIRIYSIYATIAFSVATDLFLSILPLFIVWRVRMPQRTKVSVCCLMSLGLLATGFGIARAASLSVITTDLSWMYCIAAIWSNLELFLGIICANLAIARSTYSYIFGRGNTSQNESYNYNNYPTRSPTFRSLSLNNSTRVDQFEAEHTIDDSTVGRASITRSSHSDILLINGKHKSGMGMDDEELQIRKNGG